MQYDVSVNPDRVIEGSHDVETMCKWAATGVLLVVFIGLISLAGCLHIAEFLGAIVIGIIAARTFYFGICGHNSDRLAHQK